MAGQYSDDENGSEDDGLSGGQPSVVEPAPDALADTGDLQNGGSSGLVYGSPLLRSDGSMTWASVKEDLASGDSVTLTNDITAGPGEDRLIIPENKTVTLDLDGHTVDRNRGSSDTNGHVIEVMEGAALTITDSSEHKTGKITKGWATNGGGINIHEGATVNIEGGTITGNKATDGGGVLVRGTLNMTGGSITSNTASNCGGGIYVTDQGSVNLGNANISNNIASGDDGGGLYLHLNADSTISGCTITGNRSGDYGGGIYMDAAGKTLIIKENTQINSNISSDDGGGIYLYRGSISMTGGTVSSNESNNDGGGIKITDNTSFTASGVTISNNQAKSEEGGGVKNLGTTTLTNCTICNNSAKKEGGGVFNDKDDGNGGDLTLDNCTISGNISSDDADHSNGGGVYSDTHDQRRHYDHWEFCLARGQRCFHRRGCRYHSTRRRGEGV